MAEGSPVRSLMTPEEYYASFPGNLSISKKFRNIDEELHFRDNLASLRDAQTRSFVLDFGNEDAWCAVDLEQEDLTALLTHSVCDRQTVSVFDN
jgi:hypothetical protein